MSEKGWQCAAKAAPLQRSPASAALTIFTVPSRLTISHTKRHGNPRHCKPPGPPQLLPWQQCRYYPVGGVPHPLMHSRSKVCLSQVRQQSSFKAQSGENIFHTSGNRCYCCCYEASWLEVTLSSNSLKPVVVLTLPLRGVVESAVCMVRLAFMHFMFSVSFLASSDTSYILGGGRVSPDVKLGNLLVIPRYWIEIRARVCSCLKSCLGHSILPLQVQTICCGFD